MIKLKRLLLQLAVTIIFWILILFVTYYYCRTLKYSMLYNGNDDAKVALSIKRISETVRYFELLEEVRLKNSTNFPLLSKPSSTEPFCVGVATVLRNDRGKEKYLMQTVAALLSRFEFEKYANDVLLVVFNNEIPPELHTEATVLSKFVNVVNLPLEEKYANHSFFKETNTLYNIWLGREYIANIAIARYFVAHNCRYSLIIQDDAIAAENWYSQVIAAIKIIPEKSKERWLTLKIFYSSKWAGWDKEDLYGIVFLIIGLILQGSAY